MYMPFPGSDTVPINNVSGCFTLPPNLCLEAAFYVDTITLPPVIGGYNIVYQRCCRNPTIVNLTNPGNWGSTYTSYIPMVSIDSCVVDSTLSIDTTCTTDTLTTIYDTTCTVDSVCSPACVYDTTCVYDTNYTLDTTCVYDSTYTSNTTCYYDTMCNSSPYFNNFPPVVLCINDVIDFDHSATDLDGDSLVYEFARPFHGGEWFNPAPNPSPPPFTNVVWETGYSDSYQMATVPPLALDPNTGLLTGTTSAVGQYVVCIIVKEYRNGVFISQTRRDFQFNVVNCNKTKSAIADQETQCDDYTVQFINTSANGNSYFWDFGDSNTLSDTSSLMEPQYTYADSGVYSVTLIVNPNSVCADTASSTFRIYPRVEPYFDVPANQCFDGHSFDFVGLGQRQTNTTQMWYFGAAGNPDSTDLLNSTGITFDSAGVYEVSLVYRDFGCEKIHTDTIEVLETPQVYFQFDTNAWCDNGIVNFINQTNVNLATTYSWDFGDPDLLDDTSSVFSPSYTYQDTGVFTIQLLAVTDSGCVGSFDSIYQANPRVSPNFISPPSQCFLGHSFDFFASGVKYPTTTLMWIFGDSINSDTSMVDNPTGTTFDTSGWQMVSLTYSDYGCVKTQVDSVYINVSPVAHFTIDTSQRCDSGLIIFNNESTTGSDVNYFWDFGDLSVTDDTSSQFEPSYVYNGSGSYTISLAVSTDSGCSTIFDTIRTEHPIVRPFFNRPASQCFEGHSFDFTAGGVFDANTAIEWFFGANASPDSSLLQYPAGVAFDTSGVFNVSLRYSAYGCTSIYSDNVSVLPSPLSNFSVDTSRYCDLGRLTFNNQTVSGVPVNYHWDFGVPYLLNDTSILTSPNYIYDSAGSYLVVLTVATDSGCVSVKDTNLLVKPRSIVGFGTINDVCFSDHSIDFSPAGKFYPSTQFTWVFTPDGIPDTSFATYPANITFSSPGTKTIEMTYEDFGCVNSITTTFNLLESPVAVFVLDTNKFCFGDVIQFNGSSESTNNTYFWDFGDGETSTELVPFHTYQDTGTYDVQFTITGPNGCQDSTNYTTPITVLPVPEAGFSPRNMETFITESTFEFEDLSQFGTSIIFNVGEGSPYTQFGSYEHTYSLPGTYQLSQIVFNEIGCSDTAFGEIIIKPGDFFYMPNSFTPNGDGINEDIKPVVFNADRGYLYMVFDRWGAEIFTTNDINKAWDGRVKGKEMAKTDTYQYLIRFIAIDDKRFEFIGHINLLR